MQEMFNLPDYIRGVPVLHTRENGEIVQPLHLWRERDGALPSLREMIATLHNLESVLKHVIEVGEQKQEVLNSFDCDPHLTLELCREARQHLAATGSEQFAILATIHDETQDIFEHFPAAAYPKDQGEENFQKYAHCAMACMAMVLILV